MRKIIKHYLARIIVLLKEFNAYASNGDFDESIELMLEMSENYKVLIDLFPEKHQGRI